MSRDWNRAVSTTLGYVLTLGITAILVSGLLFAAGNFVEEQREDVIQTELDIVGEQIASHIHAADRLNQSGEGETEVLITQPFPAEVTRNPYDITLVEEEDPYLLLESRRPDVSSKVPLTNTTAVAQSSASGGTIQIEYDPDRGDSGAVVIKNG